ncbi:hypothetical protein E3N88_22636 [Mikania micrantha]|uniref:Uncharacterized protein n=1 Tax=Mikania micrantha TaxID=192012 RepID=A0A5N6NDN7_9ASTR|nr:hypothetical protein E3N88_22636 [Mikania micrantha]
MPPTHTITQAQGTLAATVEEPLSPTTQKLMRVVTQLQARFPDPEPIMSEVGPSSSEGVNAGEAATTVDLNQGLQDSGCQETTSGGGGAGAGLRTPSPSDSTHMDEGTKAQELTAIITTLQARVANLEAEVATLRLEIQTKDATILDLKRRSPVIFTPFHPDPATTTYISPNATKKGENVSTAGSGPEVREEEGAQEVNPSIVTLTTEWDDFLSTYFHDSSTTSSSSSSKDTLECAKETEQHTTTHSVDTNKESPKMVGQLEEVVNAEVNSEAAAASEGPVIIDDSSTDELLANEPVGEATGSVSSGVKLTADDKGAVCFLEKRSSPPLMSAPRRRGQTLEDADCLFFRRGFIKKHLPDLFLPLLEADMVEPLLASSYLFLLSLLPECRSSFTPDARHSTTAGPPPPTTLWPLASSTLPPSSFVVVDVLNPSR